MDPNDPLSVLMHERLGIRGRDLRAQVRRAGRLLPKRLRREAHTILKARRAADHPKLARQVDTARVARAEAALTEHLNAIDPAERRKDRILWALGKLSALGIAIFILLVWFAWSRGLV